MGYILNLKWKTQLKTTVKSLVIEIRWLLINQLINNNVFKFIGFKFTSFHQLAIYAYLDVTRNYVCITDKQL